jgi:hypothetical protein
MSARKGLSTSSRGHCEKPKATKQSSRPLGKRRNWIAAAAARPRDDGLDQSFLGSLSRMRAAEWHPLAHEGEGRQGRAQRGAWTDRASGVGAGVRSGLRARARAIGASLLVLSALSTSGCAVFGTETLAEAARTAFSDEMSPAIKYQLTRLRSVPFAQLYVRFVGKEEAVFLLGEQNIPGGYDLWVGSAGVKLAMQGPNIHFTDGLLVDITAAQPVRDGAVWAFLRGETDEIRPQSPSAIWMTTSDAEDWVEQTATVESIQEVLYSGFAYTGLAIKVEERVSVTGRRGEFRRLYWIEPRTRSLLRMSTQIGLDDRPIVLEWIRVPDRSDAR